MSRRSRHKNPIRVQRRCSYCQDMVKVDWDDLDEYEKSGIGCADCAKAFDFNGQTLVEEGTTAGKAKVYLYVKWPVRLRRAIATDQGPVNVIEETIALVEPPTPVNEAPPPSSPLGGDIELSGI